VRPLSYHQFADERGWLRIPNFGTVSSNRVFAAAGLAGLWYLGGSSRGAIFIEPRERWFAAGFWILRMLEKRQRIENQFAR
jgi:hypothetical protein